MGTRQQGKTAARPKVMVAVAVHLIVAFSADDQAEGVVVAMVKMKLISFVEDETALVKIEFVFERRE